MHKVILILLLPSYYGNTKRTKESEGGGRGSSIMGARRWSHHIYGVLLVAMSFTGMSFAINDVAKVTEPPGLQAAALPTPRQILGNSEEKKFLQQFPPEGKEGNWLSGDFFSSEFTRIPTANTPNIYAISLNLEIHTIIPILEMKKMRQREVLYLDRRSKAEIPSGASWLQEPQAEPLLYCSSLNFSWPNTLAHSWLAITLLLHLQN